MSISAHYLTDMTVVLRSLATDQSVCSSCCFHYDRCKLGGKKGRKLISSTSRSDSWDLNQLGLQSKARGWGWGWWYGFSQGNKIRLKHFETELLVTLQQLRPLAKTCCATGGVIVHTKEREIEEGAERREKKKRSCTSI